MAYAFSISMISRLAEMTDSDAADEIHDIAATHVAENTGTNHVDYDRDCENVENAIWEQVFMAREITALFE